MIFEKCIKVKDIELRFPTKKMAEGLCDIILHNQAEFKYIDEVRAQTDIAKCEGYLKSMAKLFKMGGGHYSYMIFKDKVLIGRAGIKVRPNGLVGELSYFLDKRYTGNGYATQATKALEDLFFKQGGHRCEIFCNEMNKNSRKLAERLGYQLDGIMREYELIDGVYSGVAIYSKINGYWC